LLCHDAWLFLPKLGGLQRLKHASGARTMRVHKLTGPQRDTLEAAGFTVEDDEVARIAGVRVFSMNG
jgi:hypothetical protein